jgi:hypothetical protein
MKKAIFLCSILTTLTLNAQTPSTARFPGGPTGLPASAVNPGLPASAVNPGLPGFDNSFAPFFTNQFGNGLTNANLNQLLLNLQVDLSQIWPVLASINESFDFTSTGGTNISASSTNFFPGTTMNQRTGTAANASTLFSSSSGANLGTSLGQDLSGIIGGRGTAVSPAAPALNNASVSPAVTPIAGGGFASNSSTGVQPGFVGNGFNFTSTRDVLRALIVLQSDVERMLPLVNALNGGNPTNLVGTTPFTNNFGTVNNGFFTTRPANTSATRTLTPTGR